MTDNRKLVFIDGSDALAYFVVLPGPDADHVRVEAGSQGIDKGRVALLMRQLAEQWLAEAEAEE